MKEQDIINIFYKLKKKLMNLLIIIIFDSDILNFIQILIFWELMQFYCNETTRILLRSLTQNKTKNNNVGNNVYSSLF